MWVNKENLDSWSYIQSLPGCQMGTCEIPWGKRESRCIFDWAKSRRPLRLWCICWAVRCEVCNKLSLRSQRNHALSIDRVRAVWEVIARVRWIVIFSYVIYLSVVRFCFWGKSTGLTWVMSWSCPFFSFETNKSGYHILSTKSGGIMTGFE